MIDQNTPVSEALDDPRTRQFSRMPVYDEESDRITGKILRHDLFIAERSGQGDMPVKSFAKEIIAVSEKLPVAQLLELMLKKQVHLCRVTDGIGETTGIVTLEDAIETLLGREIVDESDAVEDMQELARDKYRERLRDDKVKPAKLPDD